MKVVVVGSRGFENKDLLFHILDNMKKYCADFDQFDLIISGGAKGADLLAEQYAQERGIKTKIFLPDYIKHLQGAPIRRNALMVQTADLVVAFWDGKSKGTGNTIKVALKHNKTIIQIDPGTRTAKP